MTSFRILGSIEAGVGEERLPIAGRRQLAVLAFLLLHANRPVSGDALSDAVWGRADRGGLKRLPMAIMRLRKALAPLAKGGDSVLRSGPAGYVLSVAPGELDAEVFQTRLKAGRRALEEDQAARAAEMLRDALALWRGPALAEVAFEDFAQAEIRRLEELRLVALEARIDADLHQGRHAELIGELEALVAEHCTRERLAGQLMVALYRSDRQAEALEVYQRVRAELAEQLGLEPGPALQELQRSILNQAPCLDARTMNGRRRHTVSQHTDSELRSATGVDPATLPVLPTVTIGRQREVAEVASLLHRPDVRLVTLTGPGGVGKTRLAIEVAHAVESSFEDGVYWVELAGVAHPEDVSATVARSLAVIPQHNETAEAALRRYVAEKHMTLALDNFEHVLEAAGLISRLCGTGSGLTLLITSREPLNLSAEHRVVVEPLAVPTPAAVSVASIESTPATALFVAAARRHDSRFEPTPFTAPVIARICARLDGLPLAVELAAARAEALGVQELAALLDETMSSLGAAPRDAPVRQRTLTATIEWSYRLLADELQSGFARFAVFVGGATLKSAREVTGVTLETFEALIAKSLITQRAHPDSARRLIMLETVRHYALDRLAEDPGQASVRERHAEHYLALVQWAVARLSTHGHADARATLDREFDNIHAALEWALQARPATALRLAGHLSDYWQIRASAEGLRWLDAALQAAGEDAQPQDRARASLGRAHFLARQNRHPEARETIEQALDLYRRVEDHAGIGRALQVLADHVWVDGERGQAHRLLEEACAAARISGDDAVLGLALAKLALVRPAHQRRATLERAAELLAQAGDFRGLASVYSDAAYGALIDGDASEAMRLLNAALPAVEAADSPTTTVTVFGNLGLAHLFSDDLPAALRAFEQQLQACLGHAFPYGANEGLAGVAAISARSGRPEQAARLLGAARSLARQQAGEQPIEDRLEREYFAPARSAYGPIAWERVKHAGAKLPYDEAIHRGLEELAQMAGLLEPHAATARTGRVAQR